jgi:hypothetical protein
MGAAVGKTRILDDEIRFIVKSQNNSVIHVKRRIWIGDEEDKDYGNIFVRENEFRRVKSIRGKIIGPSGKTLKKLKKREIRKIQASPSYQLYSGATYYTAELTHPTLPYIVEYSYTIQLKSLFFWPDWLPQEDIPIAQARYILQVPADIRYRTLKRGPIPDPYYSESLKSLVWELDSIPPSVEEFQMAPEDQEQYALYFTPLEFMLDGINGSFHSWNLFGAWYNRLADRQYSLDQGFIREVNISHEVNTVEKIQTIYSYLQQSTRYVAIELGIHGWKPHPAQSVFTNKYGDCKDLTALFISLLRHHGIEAYPALVLTRDKGIVENDFPSSRFNHVITFVPLSEETLWVDCTTDYATITDPPAGVEGCNVLVVRDSNSELVTTPLSRARDNQLVFKAVGTITPDGSVQFSGTITGCGNLAQFLRSVYSMKNEAERRNTLIRWLGDYSPAIKLGKMTLVNLQPDSQPVQIQFEFKAVKYVNTSRNRIFLNPSFFHRTESRLEEPQERRTAVFYRYPRIYLDSITYIFPENYRVEDYPSAVSLESPSAVYRYSVSPSADRITYSRRMQINNRRIELEEYPQYYQLMRQAQQTDSKKVVLIKKER